MADRAAVEALFARAADYVALERGPTPPAAAAEDLFEGDLPPGVERALSLHLGLEGAEGLDGVASAVFGYPLAADAYLGLLLLAPEARGRGAGRTMVEAVAARARARGATRLLVAVLDANPRGRAFWEREGFRPEARFEGRAIGARVHGFARMARPL